MKNNKILFVISLFTAFGFGLKTANAAVTRIPYVDPLATARGNAFAATADNPSAVF